MSPRRYQFEPNSSTRSGTSSRNGGAPGSCGTSAAFAALPKRIASTPTAAAFEKLRINHILRLRHGLGLRAISSPIQQAHAICLCSTFADDRRRRRWRLGVAAGPAQTELEVVRRDILERGRI